jgi:hypothetical protein
MRNLVRALLAVGGLAALGVVALGVVPAEAVGSRYPFCMQGDEAPGLSDCRYATYQQCQATASGRFLYCIANPYYSGGYAGSGRGRARNRSDYPPY